MIADRPGHCSGEIQIYLGTGRAHVGGAPQSPYTAGICFWGYSMVIARSFSSAAGRGLATLLLATLAAPVAFAQRDDVPFRMGIPVAPGGLADKPLGTG